MSDRVDTNAITYKEVFPLLRDNEMWVGYTSLNGGRWMILPKGIEVSSTKAKPDGHGNMILNVAGVCWFANIDHGKRHELLQLDTMEHNLKFNKKLKKKLTGESGEIRYPQYDNCKGIEVPFVECIPSDYKGIMGVPITFLDNYNPNQFEILGMSRDMDFPTKVGMRKEFLDDYFEQGGTGTMQPGHPDLCYYDIDGNAVVPYRRIMIRAKKGGKAK